MGAFAAVRVPVDLTRRRFAADVARDVVAMFPGTRNTVVDDGTATVSFEMQFPGNLSALVAQLHERLIPTGDAAEVSIPIVNRVPQLNEGNPEAVHRELEAGEGMEVWDPEFVRGRYVLSARVAGDRIEASVLPCSQSMHELYDTMLHLGFIAAEPAA